MEEQEKGVSEEQQSLTLEEMDEKSLREYVRALEAENELLIDLQLKEKGKVEQCVNQLSILKKDFDNFKRRNAQVAEAACDEGKISLLEKIIPILDTFERAEQGLQGKEELKSFRMVYRQFEKFLKETGIEEIEVLGQPFDPNTAHALFKEEAGQENQNIVLEVLSKGYKYKEKILRYSTVKVGV